MHTALLDAEVHHAFIDRLRQTGSAPSRHEVSAALAKPIKEIEDALCRLAESHGVVLHPHVCEPWVIHPFSLSPTATWVQQGDQGWWAPCIWCGCGIAALVGGNAVIHARLGGEIEDIDIHICNGEVVEKDLWGAFCRSASISMGQRSPLLRHRSALPARGRCSDLEQTTWNSHRIDRPNLAG
jgi:hypothetical protein